MSERMPHRERARLLDADIESAERERVPVRGDLLSLRKEGVPDDMRAIIEGRFGGAARALYFESGDDQNPPFVWLGPASISREEAVCFDPIDSPNDLDGLALTCELSYLERSTD